MRPSTARDDLPAGGEQGGGGAVSRGVGGGLTGGQGESGRGWAHERGGWALRGRSGGRSLGGGLGRAGLRGLRCVLGSALVGALAGGLHGLGGLRTGGGCRARDVARAARRVRVQVRRGADGWVGIARPPKGWREIVLHRAGEGGRRAARSPGGEKRITGRREGREEMKGKGRVFRDMESGARGCGASYASVALTGKRDVAAGRGGVEFRPLDVKSF